MKTLLVLGAGILQLPVILKCKKLGIKTVVLDGDANAPGLRIGDKNIVVNIVNPKYVIECIKDIHIDGVIHPCSEVAMNTMGTIVDKYELPGIGLETVLTATNKHKMRKAFERYGAPSPVSFEANNFDEFCLKYYEIDEDAIIKPSRNSGSRGVTKLLKGINIDVLLDAFNRALEHSKDNSVVVEQYVEGNEYSVELVIFDNKIEVLAITDKVTTGAPYFVELGHSQPSQCNKQNLVKVKKAAIDGCKALGLNWCAAHAEIKLQINKPYIIEIGARLGGDFISTELVYLSTGIDMVAAAINVSLGNVPDLRPKHYPQGAVIRYFTPKLGKITKLTIPDSIESTPMLYQIDIYKQVGDIIPEIKSSLDRSGHIITIGKDVVEAINNAETIMNRIEYETI
jgi:biotin carboxylase